MAATTERTRAEPNRHARDRACFEVALSSMGISTVTTEPTLLILGTRTDPHVDRVATELDRRGRVRVFVLDYQDDTRFALEGDVAGELRFWIDGVELPERCLVWDRTKIIPGTGLYLQGDPTSSGYAAREWRALYKLLCGLHRGSVVNSLESRACMIKPYQQRVAARAGFRVPPTLISNDKASVLAFQGQNSDRLIMKSVSAGKVKPATDGGENIPFNVMTMRVEPADLDAATEEELAYCPHFFQREIGKSHELRVVVVAGQMLAFRIDSQGHELTAVDWRKGLHMAGFAPIALEDVVESRIRTFMTEMGLFTGSLDLIVDREGQEWFLECNQDGAWGWLDDLVEGAVTRMFADGFERRLEVGDPAPVVAS